jgi:hypothetical protein
MVDTGAALCPGVFAAFECPDLGRLLNAAFSFRRL